MSNQADFTRDLLVELARIYDPDGPIKAIKIGRDIKVTDHTDREIFQEILALDQSGLIQIEIIPTLPGSGSSFFLSNIADEVLMQLQDRLST